MAIRAPRQRPFVRRDLSRFSVSNGQFQGQSNREQIWERGVPRALLCALASATVPAWFVFGEGGVRRISYTTLRNAELQRRIRANEPHLEHILKFVQSLNCDIGCS